MYARVVRFTDVNPYHLAGRLDEVDAREGPPVDIPAKGVQVLHDPEQRTAVVIQLFETADESMSGSGGRTRRDGPGGHAGDARLDRPLRDQGRGGAGVRRRAPHHARGRASTEVLVCAGRREVGLRCRFPCKAGVSGALLHPGWSARTAGALVARFRRYIQAHHSLLKRGSGIGTDTAPPPFRFACVKVARLQAMCSGWRDGYPRRRDILGIDMAQIPFRKSGGGVGDKHPAARTCQAARPPRPPQPTSTRRAHPPSVRACCEQPRRDRKPSR